MLNIPSKKQETPKFIGTNKNTPKKNNNLWVSALGAQKVAPQKSSSINAANTKQHEKTKPTTKKENQIQEKYKNAPPSEPHKVLNLYVVVFIISINHYYAQI